MMVSVSLKYLMKLLSLRVRVSLKRLLIQFSTKGVKRVCTNITVKVHVINTGTLRISPLSQYFLSFFAFHVVIWPGIEILTMPFFSSWKALSTERCLKNSEFGTWINRTLSFFSHIWVLSDLPLDFFITFMWLDQNVTFHSPIFPS